MDSSHPPKEPAEPLADPPIKVVKRPWSVTLLTLGVLIITVINLTRFILSLRYWSFLASQPGISPIYLAATGLIWTIASFPLVWGLWRSKNWAPGLMQAEALTYALYYWLDLLFLKNHPVSGATGAFRAILPTNWQFSAGVTVVCLAYMVWTLRRPKVKAYFGLSETETMPDQAQNNQRQ